MSIRTFGRLLVGYVFCLTILVALMTQGCQPIEQTARDSIVAAQAFLVEAKHNHPECNPDLPADDPLIIQYGPQTDNAICQAIYKAIRAQNESVDLLDSYCGGQAYLEGAQCLPSAESKQQFIALLKNKIRELNLYIGQLRRR